MVFLFILIVLILLIVFSKIKIEIENFQFTSSKLKNYKITIKLCILGILPITQIKVTKKLLKKLNIKEKIYELEIKLIENRKQYDKKFFEKTKLILRKAKINVKSVILNMELGTENAGATAIIVGFVSGIIGIYLSKKAKKQKFEIKPIYIGQNLINIQFWGIFEIKMIHIINIIYILMKKEGEDKNERTSNRRTYDYSYE